MVFRLSEKERLILVIDEYPYVARAAKGLASTLQLLIDKFRDTSKMMLILCSSSMSSMEEHVLAYKVPLYGRQTAQISAAPLILRRAVHSLRAFTQSIKPWLTGSRAARRTISCR